MRKKYRVIYDEGFYNRKEAAEIYKLIENLEQNHAIKAIPVNPLIIDGINNGKIIFITGK